MSPDRAENTRWTEADVPGQQGRTAVITGANSGLGLAAARALAAHGATVVLACRDTGRAGEAAARIQAEVAGAAVRTLPLDLASLDSVRAAAAQLRTGYPPIDLLINNAGVMMPPLGHTADGFELQFGVNHLGHFALTGLILGRLLAAPGSRVITVSSNGHRAGRIDFADPNFEHHRYLRMRAYGQSKLANLMFTYELQRRLTAAGAATIAVAAHPGSAATSLERHLPGWMQAGSRVVPHQGAAAGALPLLRAATDPAVRGGEYYGPGGWAEFTGYPVRVRSSARSHDTAAQRRLWELSGHLTGVSYDLSAAAGHPAS
jgi:NAD(P)-dependent dehydrogenase (short-subunit alcohol dehydrogenase family)